MFYLGFYQRKYARHEVIWKQLFDVFFRLSRGNVVRNWPWHGRVRTCHVLHCRRQHTWSLQPEQRICAYDVILTSSTYSTSLISSDVSRASWGRILIWIEKRFRNTPYDWKRVTTTTHLTTNNKKLRRKWRSTCLTSTTTTLCSNANRTRKKRSKMLVRINPFCKVSKTLYFLNSNQRLNFFKIGL